MAFTRRDSAEQDGITLNHKDTKIATFGGKHVGDGDYIRVKGTDKEINEYRKSKSEVTYIWQGKIHHSIGELEQIRVVVLIEDWEDIPDARGDNPATTDVVETDFVLVDTGGEELLVELEYGGTNATSATSDEFNIDADRPLEPHGAHLRYPSGGAR